MRTIGNARAIPEIDIDPFSDQLLHDPYPMHEMLRETGPIIHIKKYGVIGVARHKDVRAVLSDWQTFCSSAGVGLADFRQEKPWRPPGLLLENDPPMHDRFRTVLTRILSPAAISKLREAFQLQADRLIDELIERRTFDAVTDLAEPYPLKVFPDALGMPESGRERLLPYGDIVFNAFGPRNQRCLDALVNAQEFADWLTQSCRREILKPGGFGAQIYEDADRGEISEAEAAMLVRAFLSAGLDTTVNALGSAVLCLATHREQWDTLRANPSLARNAFEEVLRLESPIQMFFRTTTTATSIDGEQVGSGQKILMFLGAANRDPRSFDAPHRFDIRRRAVGHVGFGTGIHGCVGQAVARLEGEIILSTMARKIRTIELAGEPVRRLNNTLRGLQHLPVRIEPGVH